MVETKSMLTYALTCHGVTVRTAVQSLCAEVEQAPTGCLSLRYRLSGDTAQLRIPAPQPPAAVDGLWEHTCFEAFVAVEGEARYREFNFSPSGQWAAYAFKGYRKRSEWTARQTPFIAVARAKGQLLVEALIAADDLPPNDSGKPLQLGLAAVLEAEDGRVSYWALRHPAPRPDFHHRAGFVSAFCRTF
jgi:hypothetical protein